MMNWQILNLKSESLKIMKIENGEDMLLFIQKFGELRHDTDRVINMIFWCLHNKKTLFSNIKSILCKVIKAEVHHYLCIKITREKALKIGVIFVQ